MSNGIVTIAGTRYAAGLYWQPSDSANVPKAARAAAKQPGFQADFYCVRPPTKSQPIGQFGLGFSASMHRAGMPSLAACLTSQTTGSWAGAFRAQDGVYFIAVRDDLIDPDGDAWFSNDDDAQSRLEQEIARGGLSEIYAPPEWAIPHTIQGNITTLLSGRKDFALSAVGVSRSMIFALSGVVIVAGLLFAGYTILQEQEAKRAAEEAAQQAALLAAQRGMMPSAQYPKSWQDAPRPLEYLLACGQAMEKISARTLGWTISSLQCSGTNLSVAWSRGGPGGYAVTPADGKAVLDPTLATASIGVPLESLQPRGEETLAHYSLIDQAVMAKNWPIKLTSMPDDAIAVPPDTPPPPPPAWRKRAVVYTINGAPWLRPELFDNIPGLVITTVKQAGEGNFTIEGIIYENKQP